MEFNNEKLLVDETLYFTGNGYIGVRGNFEEGYKKDMDSIRGTYVNGFYEDVDITYGESAYGFPTSGQKMVNVTDAQGIEIYIGKERFSVFEGEVLDIKRKLDLDKGIAVREVKWKSPSGHTFNFLFKRMASFTTLELFTTHVEISSLDYAGQVTIVSKVIGEVENYTNPNDPRIGSGHARLLQVIESKENNGITQLISETFRSKHKICASVGHSEIMKQSFKGGIFRCECTFDIKEKESKTFSKYVVYTDSIRHENLVEEGYEIANKSAKRGFLYFELLQEEYLNEFWKFSKIHVRGLPKIEEALNYSVYQLLASAGKDPNSNICAKGLSGEGYEGHYFWDTEVYMLPFFTLTNPKVAKNLMKFRYAHLDKARERAVQMGHNKGAKIPWRTISGTECSGYFPAGSAQYHINSDVAFSYIQYYLLHDDMEFIKEFGFEVLLETGRLWLDMGVYNNNGDFMIHDVTGPDEYTAIVDNNYYTNSLAKYHLTHLVKIGERLRMEDTERFNELKEKLEFSDEELLEIKKAGDHMFLNYDDEHGIYMQDDSFKNKPVWNFKQTPKENYPLLLHYHPLTIYRHKVLKQADALLSMVLLDDVKTKVFENSYDYYEPLTTHDSSLSPCVYSMAASRINRSEKAFDFFNQTIRLDLDNLHHNTKDGLHIANAGGAYMAVVYGFAGLRIKESGLQLRPHKPKEIEGVEFNVNVKGIRVNVNLDDKIRIAADQPINIVVYGETVEIIDRVELNYKGN